MEVQDLVVRVVFQRFDLGLDGLDLLVDRLAAVGQLVDAVFGVLDRVLEVGLSPLESFTPALVVLQLAAFGRVLVEFVLDLVDVADSPLAEVL